MIEDKQAFVYTFQNVIFTMRLTFMEVTMKKNLPQLNE